MVFFISFCIFEIFSFVVLGDFCEYKFFDRVKLIESSDKIYWKIGKRFF